MRILFARHNVRVYRFALRFVVDQSTADDVVSECFWMFGVRPPDSRADLKFARNKSLAVLRRSSTEELDDEQADRRQCIRRRAG
jgi:RNA polymerase sigma-70 factor (ECF subfamily)